MSVKTEDLRKISEIGKKINSLLDECPETSIYVDFLYKGMIELKTIVDGYFEIKNRNCRAQESECEGEVFELQSEYRS